MFWRSVQAGVLAAGRDFDVEIQWNGPTKETDFSRQIQIVESMINGRVDGIVLSPTERIALVGVVERAADLGIPVTILDSKVETDRYVSFVATNNYEAGLSGARRVSELLGGTGRVAVIRDVPGAFSSGERERAFEAALQEEYAGLEIVAEQYAMADRARAPFSSGERERAFEAALQEEYAGLEIVAEQYAMADRAPWPLRKPSSRRTLSWTDSSVPGRRLRWERRGHCAAAAWRAK